MEKIEKLASRIYQEEKSKHAKPYQILSAMGKRLFDEYGVRDIEADTRYLYVSNVKVFDIKAV